ncbi:hypothetical protein FRZ40_07520 [Paraburkholderia azotifigens]|uniref:Uncharacterized protein n=1 Tax=Paraburkholderia azotifigens TaxID=2057004 RepID=A0A5C6VX16_9BURK|nr:hypothetical protein FRZ40_07520 [Paraburkholderia azotifigens]
MEGERGRKETAILPPIASAPPAPRAAMQRAKCARRRDARERARSAACPGLPEGHLRQVRPSKMG